MRFLFKRREKRNPAKGILVSVHHYIPLCRNLGYHPLVLFGFLAFSFFNALFIYLITRRSMPFMVYVLILILSFIGCLFLPSLYKYFLRIAPPFLDNVLAHLKLGPGLAFHGTWIGNEQSSRGKPFSKRWDDNNVSKISYFAILMMVVTLGCYLRFKCYLNPNSSLWADEANVVIWLLDHGLFHTIFEEIPNRPIGYMILSFFLMKTYNVDWLIKLPSIIPSVLSLIIVWRLSQRMLQSRLMRLVAIFMVSINLHLIFFGNELKPYALEFLLHLLTLYASVKYIQESSLPSLGLTLSSCFVSIFFTVNILFSLPSVMLVLSATCLRGRKHDHFFVILLSSFFFLVYLVLIAVFQWSHIEAGTRETVQFYGNNYQTFYTGDHLLSHILWYVQKTAALIYKSLESKIFLFPSVDWRSFLTISYSALYVAGLVVCGVRKKYGCLVLFLLPVLMAILFNFLNLMPYGPDRTNLYLFAYFPIPVLLAIDSLYTLNSKTLKLLLTTAILGFFFVLQFPYDPTFLKYKVNWSTQTFTKQALRHIYGNNEKQPPQAICLSPPAIRAFNYYTLFDRRYSEEYGRGLIRDFRIYEMWMQDDHEVCKFMKDIFVSNRVVYIYLANPSTRQEERRIVDILNKYSAGTRTYLLENPFPVEGVGEKVFYAESLIYQEKRGKEN